MTDISQDLQNEANDLYKDLYEEAVAAKAVADKEGKAFGIVVGEAHTDNGSAIVDNIAINVAKELGAKDLLLELDDEKMDRASNLDSNPVGDMFPAVYQIASRELKGDDFNVVAADQNVSGTANREEGVINFPEREEGIRQRIGEQKETFVGIYGAAHLSNIQGYTDQEVVDSNGQNTKDPSRDAFPDQKILYVNGLQEDDSITKSYEDSLDDSDPHTVAHAKSMLAEDNYANNPDNAFQAGIKSNTYGLSEQDTKDIADRAQENYQNNLNLEIDSPEPSQDVLQQEDIVSSPVIYGSASVEDDTLPGEDNTSTIGSISAHYNDVAPVVEDIPEAQNDETFEHEDTPAPFEQDIVVAPK